MRATRRKMARRVARVLSCRTDPGWERIEAAPFTLYAGATPDSPFDGMVSFAPCLPRAVACDGFRRPPLTLAGTLLNENSRWPRG